MEHQPTSHFVPAVSPATAALETVRTGDYVITVGENWATALHEIGRLHREREEAGARDTAAGYSAETTLAFEMAQERFMDACDIALALPIRQPEHVALKAEFAARYLRAGYELQTVLVEIATFGAPDRMDWIVPPDLIG